MALNPGTRLGPYVIDAALGAGGMGEVYRATDTNLKRSVAIKVLPQAVAADAQRLARFQREAEVLARLNHPHIAHVYGLERSDGATALVMELVDGPTLADRIARGPIPLEDALPIAKQIADALEAAHEQGVVHRDLKPANIKVRPDGTVKVLDFGLAKAMEGAGGAGGTRAGEFENASMSPTITTPPHLRQGYGAQATEAGMILGTAAYMSPEQATGKPVDRRSDLWAFGVVLLEMLTGRQVFDGETVSHVLAAVLKDAPDLTLLPANTPASIHKLLKRCLEKDRRKRLADAADARLEIEDALSAGTSGLEPASSPAVAAGRQPAHRSFAWPIAFVAVAAAAVLGYFAARPRGAAPVNASAAEAIQFGVSLPDALVTRATPSPDGRSLAILGSRPDERRALWIRRLDATRATEVPGLDGFTGSFAWSPDGTEIAAGTTRGTVAIRLDSGLVRSLTSDRSFNPSFWGAGGAILDNGSSRLRALTVSTGEIHESVKGLALSPFFLPDGRRFLFTGIPIPSAAGNPDGVYVTSLDEVGTIRPVLKVRGSAKYADGYLVFVRDGTLFAQPFDPQRAEVSGQPSAIVDGVRFFLGNGRADFDVGMNTITYRTPDPDDVPVWVDRTGNQVATLGAPGLYLDGIISPDGRRAVLNQVDRRQGTGDLWLYDLERGNTTRLTNDTNSEGGIHWCPDSKTIVYGWDGKGPPDVYALDVDSGTPPRLLYAADAIDYPVTCLPGGRVLILSASAGSVTHKFVHLDGQVEAKAPDVTGRGGAVSPDGHWQAFTSRDSGHSEVYVTPFDRPGASVQVSRGGGEEPVWGPDEKSLYYLAQRTIYQAAVHAGDTFASDAPVQVFTLDRDIRLFNVTPDGKRFLILREPPSGFLPVQAIVNWKAKIHSN